MGRASSRMVEVLPEPKQACATRRTQIEARGFNSRHVHQLKGHLTERGAHRHRSITTGTPVPPSRTRPPLKRKLTSPKPPQPETRKPACIDGLVRITHQQDFTARTVLLRQTNPRRTKLPSLSLNRENRIHTGFLLHSFHEEEPTEVMSVSQTCIAYGSLK